MANDFYTWVEVELPSKGAYYGGAIPPVVSVRPMTIKDDQRIAALNDEQIIPSIIENCTQEEFDSRALLSGDQLSILLKVRELSYGSNYQYTMKCPECNYEFMAEIDFAHLQNAWYSEEDGMEPFMVDLPSNGKKVELVFPRVGDEMEVAKKRKLFYRSNPKDRPDPSLSNMLKVCVKQVEGMDPATKDRYLEEGMIAMDIRFIQAFLSEKMPRPAVNFEYQCANCSHAFESDMPIGKDFFRYQPSAK